MNQTFFINDKASSGKRRATQHDVVASYRHLIKHSKFILNGAILPEEGAKFVKNGSADALSFGIAFLTHPDLAQRVLHGKPLDNVPNIKYLYGAGRKDLRLGYTDYPAAETVV